MKERKTKGSIKKHPLPTWWGQSENRTKQGRPAPRKAYKGKIFHLSSGLRKNKKGKWVKFCDTFRKTVKKTVDKVVGKDEQTEKQIKN